MSVVPLREWSSGCSTGAMDARITVLVCDPQRLVAESLGGVLATREGLRIYARVPESGIEAVSAAERLTPDVALVDHWLNDMEAPAVIRAIGARAPATQVIVLSWFHGPPHIRAALNAGAVGFLPKSESVLRVDEAIRRAWAGEAPVFRQELEELIGTIEQRAAQATIMADRLARLTPRELEVLRLLGAGLDPEQIAHRLELSAGTVRNYVQSLRDKTCTNSQTRLVALARDHGVIT